MPSQKINEHIKTIGKLAQISEPVNQKNKTYKGLESHVLKPKYEFIQTHTARRSFCTNMYMKDMPTLDIMALSGHTTEKSFLKYIKATPQKRASKMSKFFIEPNLKAI